MPLTQQTNVSSSLTFLVENVRVSRQLGPNSETLDGSGVRQ